MKNNNYFLTFLTFAIFTVCFSCKKSSPEPLKSDTPPATTIVEYLITPMNLYFTEISYVDSSGKTITILDPSEFTNGTKSFSILTKPFNAKFSTVINNSSNTKIQCYLVIKVDGEIKKTSAVNAPAMSTTNNSLNYIVE